VSAAFDSDSAAEADDVTIRPAVAGDLPAILAISNGAAVDMAANFAIEPEPIELWEESYRRTHEAYPWLVATGPGGVLAFAKASPWKGRCAYAYAAEVTVYVDPGHHRRGVGRSLYSVLFPAIVEPATGRSTWAFRMGPHLH